MLNALAQKLAQWFLLPLIKDAAVAIFRWVVSKYQAWKRKKDHKRREKENREKADAYKNSSVDDSTDSFGELP